MRRAIDSAQAGARTTGSSGRLREVWVVQRHLAHYRLPFFDRLAERLAERGLSLRVLFDPESPDGPVEANPSYCDPCIAMETYGLFGLDPARFRGLLASIRARRPVAVIVEGTPRIVTNVLVPTITRRAGGIPLLWTKGHTEEGTRKGYLTDRLRFRFFRLFDGVICYGVEGKRDLERIGIPSQSISVARNTIDTDRIFSEIQDGLWATRVRELKANQGLEGRRLVLFCSTMYPKKRHLDLVNAWPAIHAAHPDATLVLVGGGAMLEAVKARIAELEAEQIRVVGRVPEGEDYLWIGASDVSVMCGGLGLAIQQTLAFGRPMIVADEPGVDGELVRHGETGWRYPKGDVNALAEAVNSVLSDPEGCSVIARRGQDLVRNEVHVDGMVDGFLAALARAGVRLGN